MIRRQLAGFRNFSFNNELWSSPRPGVSIPISRNDALFSPGAGHLIVWLAERFRHFLGESPMAYLAKWRLKLGAEILQATGDSVAEVAAAVGYGSEAAFNRAFKREYGCPPAQFRRKRKAAPAQRPYASGQRG